MRRRFEHSEHDELQMRLASGSLESSTRFAWLWDRTVERTEFWDVDLTPSEPFATVPSRGAIVPGWLLLVPRKPFISLADLSSSERQTLLRQVRRLRRRLSTDARRIHLFEHGASKFGAPHGCGVDQAHLHIVPIPIDLGPLAKIDQGFERIDALDPWRDLRGWDYLLMGVDGNWSVALPKAPTSQFFRKAVADAVGASGSWDHRQHYFADNIRRTIDDFR